MNEKVLTADGSHTLRHSLLGELYHSDRGAVGESRHVFIEAGLRHVLNASLSSPFLASSPISAVAAKNAEAERPPLSVFEVGFGTGLNAWLTLLEAGQSGFSVDYHTIELYPLTCEEADTLNYPQTDEACNAFSRLHSVPWGDRSCNSTQTPIDERFTISKYQSGLIEFDFMPLAGQFDLIYFDAFAPDVQPELWSDRVMRSMYTLLKPGGVLVTYSSKGSVKQALRAARFEVTRLKGALGKRHMLRAAKA